MSKRAYLCGPESDSKYNDANAWAIVQPKKRRSRWSEIESGKPYCPSMSTQLPPDLTAEQEKMYILQLQVEDLSRRLKSGDLEIPSNSDNRSPSPDETYGRDGKRLNLREYRLRKSMEEDRNNYIQKLLDIYPDYKPPTDFRPLMNKMTDKIFIPQDANPQINFVGLLIGPRGGTLKALEKETGARIIIRGQGSVKEGKFGYRDGMLMPGEDEPLHAFISAGSVESCQLACRRVTEIIRQGVETPECDNDLRNSQFRELALLNGTSHEHEGLARLRAIAEAQNIATNKIRCGLCGGIGHLMSDCKVRDSSDGFEQFGIHSLERAKLNNEYSALMTELGVGYGGIAAAFSTGMNPGENLLPQTIGRTQLTKQPPPPGVSVSENEREETIENTIPLVITPSSSCDSYPPSLPIPGSTGHWAMCYPPAMQQSGAFNHHSTYAPTDAVWPPHAASDFYMPQGGRWQQNVDAGNGCWTTAVDINPSDSMPPPPGI